MTIVGAHLFASQNADTTADTATAGLPNVTSLGAVEPAASRALGDRCGVGVVADADDVSRCRGGHSDATAVGVNITHGTVC